MLKIIWRSVWLTPALVGICSAASLAKDISAPSEPISTTSEVSSYHEISNASPDAIGQVTSVSQLSDVKPTDWAFQALQSLVERYGCIAGYPDKTYRGNRALTRYEFAAGLNACLDRVNELIAAASADLVKKDDLATLQKLQEQFAAELATLRGQVDALDARTTTLEKQQFSTTTKLTGEAIFSISDAFGGERALNSDQQRTVNAAPNAAARNTALNNAFGPGSRDISENTTVSNRVRIALDTSFTGEDRLRTQLQARNVPQFDGGSTSTTSPRPNVTGTNMTRLGYDGSNNNSVELRRLEYRFPLTPSTTVFLGTGADGLEYNDSIPTLSPVESSGSGAISRFGRFNPIYRVATGSGIIINQKLGREFSKGEKFTLSLGYLAPTSDAQDPSNDRGFFNGSHAALAQLAFQPTKEVGIGFTYANSYFNSGAGINGGTGSGFANNPFNSANNPGAAANIPTTSNSYGIEATARLNPKLAISAWGGLTDAKSERRINQIGTQGSAADPVVRKGDKATIWNWAASVTFPDLLKEGNLGGIVFGMPPKVTSNEYGSNVGSGVLPRRRDRGTSYHLEGFYRHRLTDNVAVTPGLLVIFNPEHNSSNDTVFVGTIRTTFTF